MLVSDAAKKLNMNPQTLRLALQQGLFPFGVAIKTSENRFTYYVNRKRLERYLEGSNEQDCFGSIDGSNGINRGVSNGCGERTEYTT